MRHNSGFSILLKDISACRFFLEDWGSNCRPSGWRTTARPPANTNVTVLATRWCLHTTVESHVITVGYNRMFLKCFSSTQAKKKQYNWNRSWEVLPVWHDCDDCGLTSAPSPAFWFHDDSAVSDSNAHQCISMHFNVFIEWKSPEWLFSYFEGPYWPPSKTKKKTIRPPPPPTSKGKTLNISQLLLPLRWQRLSSFT